MTLDLKCISQNKLCNYLTYDWAYSCMARGAETELTFKQVQDDSAQVAEALGKKLYCLLAELTDRYGFCEASRLIINHVTSENPRRCLLSVN